MGNFGPLAMVFLRSPPVSVPSCILNIPFFAHTSIPFEENLILLGYIIPVVRVVSMDIVALSVFQNMICSLFGSAMASRFPVPEMLLSQPNSVSRGLPIFPQRTQLPIIRTQPEYTLSPSGAI